MNTIQATELRIGNFIGMNLEEYPNNFFTALEIGETMKVYEGLITLKGANIKRVETSFMYVDDFEPIPLNEDWLVRFKWDCFQEGWYGLNKYGLGHEFTWNIYDGMLRWKGSAIDCKFVHQLQNIVHALKGTELTLTDK